MAVVEPDSTLTSDASSLFLYEAADGWRRGRKLASGSVRPVKSPRLSMSTSPPIAMWMAVGQRDGSADLRALVNPLTSAPSAAPRALADGVTGYALLGVAGKAPVWIVRERNGPTYRFEVGSFVMGLATPAGSFSTPFYAGVFGAASSGNDRFVLSGPVAPDRAPFVTTQLFFYRVRCAGD